MPVPWNGTGGRARSSRSLRLERHQHAPHARDRIASLVRPAAMRGAAVRDDVDPGKSLVPDRQPEIGRLGHDRHVRAPFAHERLGAKAHVFFVGHARDDQPAAGPGGREHRGRGDHRGHAALHVLRPRPYSRPPLTRGVNGSVIPATPTVSMWPQNIIAGPGDAAFEHANHIGPPRRRVLHDDVESRRRHRAPRDLGDLALPRRAGHQRRVHGVGGDQVGQQRDGIHGEIMTATG